MLLLALAVCLPMSGCSSSLPRVNPNGTVAGTYPYTITATSGSLVHKETVNLIVQHDWHVRLLGPGAKVLNSTELAPGDTVLGYLPTKDRHVGYPIDEFCHEQ